MTKGSKTFPILTTERLTLRRLSKSDAEAILQLRSDPEINRFLDRKPSATLQEASNFIDSILENESHGLFYWAITKTGNEALIGTICLFSFASDGQQCEIGYELLPEYQRQGIMFEAAEKIVEYATETLHLTMIEAISHKDNRRSTGLLLRLGFKEQGIDQAHPELVSFRLMV